MVAVTVNSGQIKVDIGICGLAAEGLGIAVTQGAIRIAGEFIKGLPLASILGAAMKAGTGHTLERRKKIKLRYLALMVETKSCNPELLSKALALNITWVKSATIKNPPKKTDQNQNFRKIVGDKISRRIEKLKRFIRKKNDGGKDQKPNG